MDTESSTDPSLAFNKCFLKMIPSRTQKSRPPPFVISQNLEEFDQFYILQVEFSNGTNLGDYTYEIVANQIYIKHRDQTKKLMLPEGIELNQMTCAMYTNGVYRFQLPKKNQRS
jgi:hypothetical protein